MTLLCAKVKGLREAKVISRSDFVKAASISKGYLSQLEKGTYENPSMKVLKKLAKALDVSIEYLADDSFIEDRSWEKVSVDESMQLFLNKHKLSAEDILGFKRVSFQPTAPRTVVEWDRLLSNLNLFRQKARDSNPKSRTLTNDQIVSSDSSEGL